MPSQKSALIWISSVAVMLLLMTKPIDAQTSGDADRLEKLERAVERLPKRNAELELKISNLEQRTTSTPEVPAEGPTKKVVTYDGKTYLEKPVPVEKAVTDKWRLSDAITELEPSELGSSLLLLELFLLALG